MIKNIVRLLTLACILMNSDLVDARGRSSGGRSSYSSRSRSYSSSSRSRSSYVGVRTPVSRYTRSDGYVVIIGSGDMGYGQYYYDITYGEEIPNPAYEEKSVIRQVLEFCLACCIFCVCNVFNE